MKTIILSLLVLISSQGYAQKHVERKFHSFTKISVQGGFNAEYIVADRFSVNFEETKSIDAKNIITEVVNDELKIYPKAFNANFLTAKKLPTLKIYGPHLKGINVGSSSKLKINNKITEKSIVVNISSSGTLNAALQANTIQVASSSSSNGNLQLNTQNLKVKSSSSAELLLSGVAKNFEGDASSSATINASKLRTDNAEVGASSSASVYIWTTDRLKASASSSAAIYYLGEPRQKDVKKSSSGTVSKK